MKAITAVCATGASVSSISPNGRVSRHRDGENAEIQMYLSKLKDLVPYMPKNKKLTKLEVIQNVIDYICDLQSALEATNTSSTAAAVHHGFDASAALRGGQQLPIQHASFPIQNPRQPLGLRTSPNRILNGHTNISSPTDLNTISDKHINGDRSS